MGRKTALVKRYVLDCIGIEYGEHAEHVVHVIYRNTVKQQKVLVRVAAAYVQACSRLGSGLNAGEQLKGLEHIRLAEHGGYGLDLLDGNVDGAHLRSAYAQNLSVSDDGNLVEGIDRGDIYINNGIAMKCERNDYGFVTYVAGTHLDWTVG